MFIFTFNYDEFRVSIYMYKNIRVRMTASLFRLGRYNINYKPDAMPLLNKY